jgi:hypothetical protein
MAHGVQEEVVTRALADDPEIVHERRGELIVLQWLLVVVLRDVLTVTTQTL